MNAYHIQSRQALRRALGCYSTGVAIVTAAGADNQPIGMTINSFSSVSLEPALIAWCIDHAAVSHDAFASAGHFAITVLAEHQAELAMRFATRGADKFCDIATDSPEPPVIAGGCAWFKCRHYRAISLGDHTMLIGEISEFSQHPAHPLVFSSGNFRQLQPGDAVCAHEADKAA